jgi:hypothetical protein
MFQWLAVGNYNSTSTINALFKSALLRASGFNDEVFKVQISPQPKAEAAYGLVCDKVLNFLEGTDEVVAGESFAESGHERSWDTLLNADRLTKGLELLSTLSRLTHFIETYNQYANSRNANVSPLKIDNISMKDIRGRLSSSLSELKGTDSKTVQVEPIFIMALKHLLEVKINS